MNYKLAKEYTPAFLNLFCSTFLYSHREHVYCGINTFSGLLISSFMRVYGPSYDSSLTKQANVLKHRLKRRNIH